MWDKIAIRKKYHDKRPKKEFKKQCHKIYISFVLAIIESFNLGLDRSINRYVNKLNIY